METLSYLICNITNCLRVTTGISSIIISIQFSLLMLVISN